MPQERPLLLVVACALIQRESAAAEPRVLLAQRPQGKNLAGLWEFPGGKLEAGENPEQALARELREELGIEAGALEPLSFAGHAYDTFYLLMPLYLCRNFRGVPQPREGQRLAWLSPAALAADYRLARRAQEAAPEEKAALEAAIRFPLPPADIPLIPPLLKALGQAV